jgi:very-short-patch-repair endonuclease
MCFTCSRVEGQRTDLVGQIFGGVRVLATWYVPTQGTSGNGNLFATEHEAFCLICGSVKIISDGALKHKPTSCGCSHGNRSIGERELERRIKERFSDAYHAKRLLGSGRRALDLDIYIPSIGVAIEYDGAHHERPVAWNGNKREALHSYRRVRRCDARKNRLCKTATIHLVRVRDVEFRADPEGVTGRVLSEIAACSKRD